MPAKSRKATPKKISQPKEIESTPETQIEAASFSQNQKEPAKPYTVILVLLLIIAAFFIGMLYTKVQYLEKNQASTPPATPGALGLLHVAKQLDIDPVKFKSCLESNKYQSSVNNDLSDGQKAGVNGTPTTFVNGIPIVGAQPYSAFQTVIDQELAKSQSGNLPFNLVGTAYAQSGVLGGNNSNLGPISVTPVPARVSVDTGNFPVMGNKNAPVTIIEFADFQCPFCEQWFKNVEPQIIKNYVDTGKAKFAFRNYAFLGQDSVAAAVGAYCANEQGKFWAYHDFMYNHQGQENSGWASKANLEN